MTATEKLTQAINEYITNGGCPLSEFSADFAVKMIQAMMVSHRKYGLVTKAYPEQFNAIKDLQARMGRYRQTGNKHYLVDAANFAMIEAMHPSHTNSEWGSNSVTDSPGRTSQKSKQLVQQDNDGGRIMGETILHIPEDLP